MIRSAEKIAHELGYEILFAESHWDLQKEINGSYVANALAGADFAIMGSDNLEIDGQVDD